MSSSYTSYHKQYHEEHRDNRLEQMKQMYLKNRDSILSQRKEYYQDNKEALARKREENIGEYREYQRELKKKSYSINPEKYKNRSKSWRCGNKWYLDSYRSDPGYRLHSNISRAIRTAIKERKNGRTWESIVGYKLEDLINHLEKQFRDNMSWDNYGKWELDHIKPRSSFNFDDDVSIKECWSLENLQPLWMAENRRKFNRI